MPWTLRAYRISLLTHVGFMLINSLLALPLMGLTLRALLWFRDTDTLTDLALGRALATPLGVAVVIALSMIVLVDFLLAHAALSGLLHTADGNLLRLARRFGPRMLRLCWSIAWPLLILVSVAAGLAGLIGHLLLRQHDINFYLHTWDWPFPLALGLVILLALAVLIIGIPLLLRAFPAIHCLIIDDCSVAAARRRAREALQGRLRPVFLRLLLITLGIIAIALAGAWLGRRLLLLLAPLLTERLAGTLVLLGLGLSAQLIVQVAIGWWIFVVWFRTAIHLCYGEAGPPTTASAARAAAKRNNRRLLAAVAAGALVAMLAAAAITIAGLERPGPTRVIAHRGASRVAPENTMAAIGAAIEQGCDAVEIDVQETSDGRVVVIHDRDYMKVAGQPLTVRAASETERQTLDVGSWFDPRFADQRSPLLSEVLARHGDAVTWYIELKYYGQEVDLAGRTLAIIEEAGLADAVVVISLEPQAIRAVQALRPDIETGLLLSVGLGGWATIPGDRMALNASFVGPRTVRAIHAAGKRIDVWTVNDSASMLALCSQGIDGLITDDPATARQVVDDFQALPDELVTLVQLADRFGLIPTIAARQ